MSSSLASSKELSLATLSVPHGHILGKFSALIQENISRRIPGQYSGRRFFPAQHLPLDPSPPLVENIFEAGKMVTIEYRWLSTSLPEDLHAEIQFRYPENHREHVSHHGITVRLIEPLPPEISTSEDIFLMISPGTASRGHIGLIDSRSPPHDPYLINYQDINNAVNNLPKDKQPYNIDFLDTVIRRLPPAFVEPITQIHEQSLEGFLDFLLKHPQNTLYNPYTMTAKVSTIFLFRQFKNGHGQ